MKKICLFLLLCLSIIAVPFQKDIVLKDFNAFKSSYSTRNADETVKYFSKSSIDFYDNLLKVAVGDKELEGKGIMEPFIIMSINNHFSEAEIRKMNGKDVVKWSINEGLDSFENFNSLLVLDVYEKDEAAYIVVGNDKESMPIKLVYEEGLWKVDLPYIIDYVTKLFSEMLIKSKTDTDEFNYNEENNYFFQGEKQAPRNIRILK